MYFTLTDFQLLFGAQSFNNFCFKISDLTHITYHPINKLLTMYFNTGKCHMLITKNESKIHKIICKILENYKIKYLYMDWIESKNRIKAWVNEKKIQNISSNYSYEYAYHEILLNLKSSIFSVKFDNYDTYKKFYETISKIIIKN